jgi:hypothetical protein
MRRMHDVTTGQLFSRESRSRAQVERLTAGAAVLRAFVGREVKALITAVAVPPPAQTEHVRPAVPRCRSAIGRRFPRLLAWPDNESKSARSETASDPPPDATDADTSRSVPDRS